MNWGRAIKKICTVCLCIAGFLVVLVAGLQIFINSRAASGLVAKYAAEYVDAELKWTGLRLSFVSHFPMVSLQIDSLSITYPHDRFSSYDSSSVRSRMLQAGRGESVDTLAKFSSFSASVNIFELLTGRRIRVGATRLDGLRLYAHKYDSTAANWNIFKTSPPVEEETDSSALSLPWVSIKGLDIDGRPSVVYTAQSDTVFVALALDRVAFAGDFKLDMEDMDYRLKKIDAGIDSLRIFGRLPSDTLVFRMDSLRLKTVSGNKLDFGFTSYALAWTYALGKVKIPCDLDSRFSFKSGRKESSLSIDHFNLDLAHLPVYAKGFLKCSDSLYVDMSAGLENCDLGEILANYGAAMGEVAGLVSTDAVLSVSADAKGWLGGNSKPQANVAVHLPECSFAYKPLGLPLRLSVDADGQMTSSGVVDAALKSLRARTKGMDLRVSVKAEDVMGADPRICGSLSGFTETSELVKFLPESSGITSSGPVNLNLDVNTRLSELKKYSFDHSRIKGSIHSGKLVAGIASDSLSARINNTGINFISTPKGIDFSVSVDSLSCKSGASTSLKSRRIKAEAKLCKVEHRGKMVPKLSVSTDFASVFVKSGKNMAGLKDFGLSASLRKVVIPKNKRQRILAVPQNEQLPDFLSERDFRKSDITFSLDSSVTRLFNNWSPSFDIKLNKAFVATPSLPLRTRINSFQGNFDGRVLSLDTLSLTCGSSSVSAFGKVKGLRPILSGRKSVITVDAVVDADRINANELVAAFKLAGQATEKTSSKNEEYDESFVVDSLSNASVTSSDFSLVVLPANLVANLDLKVNNADFLDLKISPLSANLSLQKRTLKLSHAILLSNIGSISLDAFYSTLTKKNITAGADLRVSDVLVGELLHLLPSIDNMMPALKSFDGRIDCRIAGTSQLDTNMNMVMPSVDAVIRIDGRDLVINDMSSLKKITRILMFKNLEKSRISNLSVDALVYNNRLQIFPFELGVDRYNLALQGVQNFDKTMSYHVSVLKSPLLIPFGVNLWGSIDKVRFSLCSAKFKHGRIPVYTEQLDTMQINIAKSISDIYKRGAAEVRKYNTRTAGKISKKLDSANEQESPTIPAQVDSLITSSLASEIDSEIESDVTAILAESDKEIARIASEISAMEEKNKKKSRK